VLPIISHSLLSHDPPSESGAHFGLFSTEPLWLAYGKCSRKYLQKCSHNLFRYGVQSWIGGECVTLMIRSIWTSYRDLGAGGSRNSMPASSGTNTMDFLSFFLFWAGSLPAIWFPVHKIRHLFTVKAYFVPTAAIIYFGWAIGRAKGIGPIVKQPAEAQDSALAWAFVSGVMSSIANFATLIVNDPVGFFISLQTSWFYFINIYKYRISPVSQANQEMHFGPNSSPSPAALPSPHSSASSSLPRRKSSFQEKITSGIHSPSWACSSTAPIPANASPFSSSPRLSPLPNSAQTSRQTPSRPVPI
jgi:Permease for cytosine/purines, uracil, thiamine, allantoin